MARAEHPQQNWPYVADRSNIIQSKRLHASRSPTLLSLDGGGLRGVIVAQVLESLEDSIKLVLWKERLLKVGFVQDMLAHARARGAIDESEQWDLQSEYNAPHMPLTPATLHGGQAPGQPHSDEEYMGMWDRYRSRQRAMLEPPSNWALVKKCFDVDIAEFFDQLAGTSTGALLALYLASRGGRLARADDGTLRSRPGSAAGANDFYMDNGHRTFETNPLRRMRRFLASGGREMQDADGYEEVLRTLYGDMTLQDLEAFGANVCLTTIDATYKRTAFFFHMSGRAPPAYSGPNGQDGPGSSGLATPLRKGDEHKGVLVRDPRRPGAPTLHGNAAAQAAADARNNSATGWLSAMINYGENDVPPGQDTSTQEPMGTNRDDIRFITATGGWVTPLNFDQFNFKLVDVAYASSAVAGCLPPKPMRPVDATGQPLDPPPPGWEHRVFLDGVLANNDPTFMGLAQMLQRNNKAGLKDCAILSIGTDTMASIDGYNEPKPKGPGLLRRAGSALLRPVHLLMKPLQLLTGGLLRRNARTDAQPAPEETGPSARAGPGGWPRRLGSVLTAPVRIPARALGGVWKCVRNLMPALKHVGDLVVLSINLNGEDKENIFRFIYYGLLRTPEGTYLRIQIKDEPFDFEAHPDWRDALMAGMEDGSPRTLRAYEQIGKSLAARNAFRLTWWVRCFVLGLEEASWHPFVLLPELDRLDDGKRVRGGKFLALATGTGQGAF
ncbi:hypothetical protein HYH03_001227 [Edaphochlamys debaryana]|uniref:Patatin n=1 Tax=Edaphochlamys debaryana TaxID=47281 RepID=A0A836C6Z3_9CHLO|nr:hypothetical protein HYH03_001227 [Edaphochlamys debaryana]|eukprot:KAG2501444.1 hypothetical protein HYH03_001227 [Edaphochlamys debaryana]